MMKIPCLVPVYFHVDLEKTQPRAMDGGWMDGGWVDGWMDGCLMAGWKAWMDGWIDGKRG